ncbi:hypothetical protein EXIGLDRAFT_694705, partial [Exidia glandulosa HHB12029]
FPQLRKLVFRGRTSRTSVPAASSFQAPPTLERLEFFDGVDTKFLDSVVHAAVPWVEVHFFKGSHRERMTRHTVQALSAQPAIRVHVHFEPNRRASLKLVDSGGRTRIYSVMFARECLQLPLFSQVTSMAITGLDNVLPGNEPGNFSEMPELEEISIVVQELAALGVGVPCPRLAVFELVISPEPNSILANVSSDDIQRFYDDTVVADPSAVLVRLPGLDLPPDVMADLVLYFADYDIGSSVVPSILPHCI